MSDPRGRYLGGYIGFGLGYVCLVAVRSIINLLAGWQASRRIHHASMASLCLAPISFFDTTPIGRILNRFAKVSLLSTAHSLTIVYSQGQALLAVRLCVSPFNSFSVNLGHHDGMHC